MRDQDIQRLIQLNTVAPILLSKYVVRSMMSQRGRPNHQHRLDPWQSTGYRRASRSTAPTKASLIGFTRLAGARGPGNSASRSTPSQPGFIATEMTHELDEVAAPLRLRGASALKRMADPIDVARSVEFSARGCGPQHDRHHADCRTRENTA